MSLKRQSDILHAVRKTGSCSIADLADSLAVSTETIRRNVKPLVQKGTLVRFHGGIMAPENMGDAQGDQPFQRRMLLNEEAKRSIANMVRQRISDGDSLILDNGTSTAYVADALANHSRLVVVTNSAEIARRLASRNGNRVFMAGGELSGDDAAAFGPSSLEFLRQFEVRYAIISVGGITARGDLVDFHLFEAEFTRAAMAQAQATWVIADETKFGREAPVRVCQLGEVDTLFCNARLQSDFMRRFTAADVEVVIPTESFLPLAGSARSKAKAKLKP